MYLKSKTWYQLLRNLIINTYKYSQEAPYTLFNIIHSVNMQLYMYFTIGWFIYKMTLLKNSTIKYHRQSYICS